jgi:hypothetical protein
MKRAHHFIAHTGATTTASNRIEEEHQAGTKTHAREKC